MTYILWITIYLTLFYAFYWVFLRKTTFFQLKRFYLLLAGILSFSLPLLTVEQAASGTKNTIILTAGTIGQQMNEAIETTQYSSASVWDIIILIYAVGVIGSFGLLMFRSLKTHHSLKNKPNQTAFSFFNQIVIDPEMEGYDRILAHERAHVEELHSVDVLIFEVIKIINWFNPISYWMAKSAKLNHEYIADHKSASSPDDRLEYANLLLSKALATDTHTLSTNFFKKTILKPRIAMLFKNKSKKRSLVSFMLLIPTLTLAIVCQSSPYDKAIADKAMVTTDQEVDPQVPYTQTETPPSFKGGMEAFYKYIGDNFKLPKAAKQNKVKGRIVLQFIVEKDGSISNIKILNDLEYGTGEEAVRVLEKSPKWNPGIQNGKAVRVQFTLPIELN